MLFRSVTAETIVKWFEDPENRAEVQRLLNNGVSPQARKKPATHGAFSGQFVVLTGSLQDFKRSEAQKLIEEMGGECQSSVTAKTTLVIAGEAAGSKLDKAKKLNIKIIDEAQFKTLVQNN